MNQNENALSISKIKVPKTEQISSNLNEEANYRFRHYTFRSKKPNNIKESSKDSKNKNFNKNSLDYDLSKKNNGENFYYSLNTEFNQNNNIIKEVKSKLKYETNFFTKNFFQNYEQGKQHSYYSNNVFINLNSSKNKIPQKSKNNNKLDCTPTSICCKPDHKNLNKKLTKKNKIIYQDTNNDLFENDSINVNFNEITFTNNFQNDNENKLAENNKNIESFINKETMNYDIISENLGISMEIDDRYIPQFPVCINKFSSSAEMIESRNSCFNNNHLIHISDNFTFNDNNHVNQYMKTSIQDIPEILVNVNPEQVMDYIDDILGHLKNIQYMNNVNALYMKTQADINEKMRGILIDWIVEVHLKFKLVPETLFLTVNLIDRFLSLKNIIRNKLQLVGITSLFIACKYEEIYPPELKDFVFITDNAYSKQDIIDMENEILSELKFDVTTPSSLRYLEIYNCYLKIDKNCFMFCRYLLELFLLEYKMNRFHPNLLASASLYITFKITKKYSCYDLIRLSEIKEEKLRECSKEICNILDNIENSSLQAVRKKFSHPKFNEVAKIKLY